MRKIDRDTNSRTPGADSQADREKTHPEGTPTGHPDKTPDKEPAPKPKKKRRWLRRTGYAFLVLILLLVVGRLMMPIGVRWYVNRTIDQNPLYDGQIGDVDIHLWRGAYSIKDVRLIKTTGNVPVPLYSSPRMDLQIQWDALLHGKVVGEVRMFHPELNFVDDEDKSQTQTGEGGPWLKILNDLFPFKINRAKVINGSIHFRTFQKKQPVDVYLSHLDATVDNLTNIKDEVTPLVTTVKATALAMDQAKFDYEMRLDPFSYKPTFHMAVRLLGLDVTKTNNLARAYGAFDFERGWFDLVIEMDAKEGQLRGYVKPLFRDLQVLSLKQDLKEDNPLQFFWEAVVGAVTGVLKNPPRDQFGTMIPVNGAVDSPQTGILSMVGNVLRNAFIRAYLPKLQPNGPASDDGIQFGPGSIEETRGST